MHYINDMSAFFAPEGHIACEVHIAPFGISLAAGEYRGNEFFSKFHCPLHGNRQVHNISVKEVTL